MLKRLAKTGGTWEKIQPIITSKHQLAQILQYCLRTRFHHFCRGVRPSRLHSPVTAALQHLKAQHPRDELYQNLPEPLLQDQSIADYIDAWFIQRFLGVTGQWNANDVTAPNQLRATFPRRRGGMGFTTLNDVIP